VATGREYVRVLVITHVRADSWDMYGIECHLHVDRGNSWDRLRRLKAEAVSSLWFRAETIPLMVEAAGLIIGNTVDLKPLQEIEFINKKRISSRQIWVNLECLTATLAVASNKSGRNTACPRICHRVGITQV
jgi:hypothetical protein